MVPSSQDKSQRIAHLPGGSGLWLLLLTFMVLFTAGFPALASAPETWMTVESNTTEDLQKITFGVGTYVAVGHNGTIVTSSDAIAWKISSSGTSAHLYSAAYGRNLFVVVGEKGLILTSPDGLSWTAGNSGTDKLLYDIIFANDRFTAVGYDGTIVYSTDGTTWNKGSSAYTEFIPAIAYGGGTYSAVNVNGNTMTSTDAVTWTKQSSVGKMPRAMDYAKGRFTAVSYDGTISISSDGKAWNNQSIDYMIGTEDVWTDGTYFVAAGAGGKIFYSTDGTSWTAVSSGINQHLNGGCTGSGEFVIVGDQGAILKTGSAGTADKLVPGGQKVMRYQIGSTKFTLNGAAQAMDTAPRVAANRTMLPVRFVATPLGATVNWNAAEKKTTIKFNDKTIELWTGRATAKINGVQKLIDTTNNKVKPYVVPPGRTMLPLRFIAENLGCDVKWDPKTKQITITYPKPYLIQSNCIE